MSTATALAGVLRNDARRMARDRFLVSSASYMLGSSLAMRWILPWVGRVVRARWGLDLTPYHPLIVSYFAVVMAALAVGLVGGFLLLESREDRTLVALATSPLRLRTYVWAVSGVLTVAGVVIIFAEAELIGLGVPPPSALLGTAVAGGLSAPLVALSMAALASNKLEAFALTKLLGLAGAVPLGAFFLPVPWQYVACLIPPFWAVKGWWVAEAGGSGWAAWIAGGVLVSGALIALLADRLERASREPEG